MKEYKKKLLMIIILLIILILIETKIYAFNSGLYNDIYDPTSDGLKFIEIGEKILGVLQAGGLGVGLIMIIVNGIKYFSESVQEKATYKERMLNYLLGAVLFFGATKILEIGIEFISDTIGK